MDIASNMKIALASREPEFLESPEHKISLAAECLRQAANRFDRLGSYPQAELLTRVLESLVQNR